MVIEIDDSDIKRVMSTLAKTMNSSKAGKAIKREVSKELRTIMGPMLAKRKASVLRLPSHGHPGAGMRQAIAKQTKATTRWSGMSGGVSISQQARGMPRGFNMAGRAFNRSEGWHPKNLGGVEEHQFVRPVAWFDSVADGHEKDAARQDIVHALEAVAVRLAAEIKSI